MSVRQELEAATSAAKLETEAAPGRDARGRFAKKEGTETGVNVGAPPPLLEPSPAPLGTPPGGWSAEAKAAYGSLPPAVQLAIAKREAEMSDGARKWSEERKGYADIDKVFNEPRRNALKQIGRSPADFTEQAWLWHQALSAPNEQARTHAWLMAAQTYNIRLPEIRYDQSTGKPTLYNAPTVQQTPQPAQPPAPPPPPQPDPRVDQLAQQVTTLGQQVSQVQQAHEEALNAQWNEFASRNQQHLNNPRVSARLAATLNTPSLVKHINGRVDLDGHLNEALWAEGLAPNQVVQANNQAAKDAAAHRAEHAAAARRAGVSIAPRPQSQPISQKTGPKTVRDRIYQSMDELSR
jgi:hypothetical protein